MKDQAQSLRMKMMGMKKNLITEKETENPAAQGAAGDLLETSCAKEANILPEEIHGRQEEEKVQKELAQIPLRQEEETEKDIDDTFESGIVKIFAVVSGKGGVGKTNVSVNLAIAMAARGKKVLLMDADIGMTNADIVMGIHYEHDLFDYLEGRVGIHDIIYEGPQGVKVVSGGAGLLELNVLTKDAQKTLIKELISVGGFEVMIIDNGAGITKETLSFITFAHEVVLVTTPEPTAITDAYRVLKTISYYALKSEVKIIVNKVATAPAGKEAFLNLKGAADAFLSLTLEDLGYIFDDSRVGKAIMKQEPVILSYPNALSSSNIHTIAGIILEEKVFTNNISTMKQLGNRFMKIFGT